MFAHSDASLKNGIATHSYILRTYKGRKVKEIAYVSHETNSVKAEIDSLVKLLNYCASKNYKGLKIYSDCKPVVDSCNNKAKLKIDTSYLKHMLNSTGSKIKWKSRLKNSEADQCCRKLMKVVQNRINNT